LARQVHFCAFSSLNLDQPEVFAARLQMVAIGKPEPPPLNPLGQIAWYLLDLPPRTIVEAVFGSCPEGLIGLLARLGDGPISLDLATYRLAWSLYADPEHRNRARLLMETEGLVTASRIRVVSHLSGVLLRRSVLDRVATPGDVQSLREAVRLIQQLVPDATDARLAQSLDALGPHNGSRISRVESLAKWTLGWLERMERAPVAGPFVDDPDFRLLVGRDLVDAGRRYRNCLAQYIGHVAAGRRVYLQHLREPEAIVELHCLYDGAGRTSYTVGQIRGHRNARLLPHDLQAIRTRLAKHGVLFATRCGEPRAPLNALLNILEEEDYAIGILQDLEMEVEDAGVEAA
jgi:hypothetical protein